jgi:hypothetical protein
MRLTDEDFPLVGYNVPFSCRPEAPFTSLKGKLRTEGSGRSSYNSTARCFAVLSMTGAATARFLHFPSLRSRAGTFASLEGRHLRFARGQAFEDRLSLCSR